MIKGILFDLDGTLIDTNELIITTYIHTLKDQLGLDISREAIISHFGEPLKHTLRRYCTEEELPQLFQCYRSYNLEQHDLLTKGFPGVFETMQALKEKGYKIAVVTSKMRDTAQRGLELFDLAQFVDGLVGFEDTEEHKPLAGPVLKGLEVLNLLPEEALMIGDSPYDLGSAHNAGVKCGIVKYTIFPPETFKEAKPDFWLNDLTDLLEYLERKQKN